MASRQGQERRLYALLVDPRTIDIAALDRAAAIWPGRRPGGSGATWLRAPRAAMSPTGRQHSRRIFNGLLPIPHLND